MAHHTYNSCLCGKALDITEQQVDQWIRDNKYDQPWRADLFRKHLGNKPVCQWLGDWTKEPKNFARGVANNAKANNALYQIVLYNIPNRDAGGFSSGGAASRTEYMTWIKNIAAGLGSVEGIIIVEPDALAHAPEFDDSRKEQRLGVLREAVAYLRNKCKNAHIYLDVGHPSWLHVDVATELFIKAGGRAINGIALNVSNSQWTESCFRYGLQITEKISASHGMVIDTSRNGNGPPPKSVTGTDAWANPPSNRLGAAPALRVRPPNIFNNRLHALLWVKVPGESDGEYNSAPKAGVFWPEGAQRLIGC